MTGSKRAREKLVELKGYLADLENQQGLQWVEFMENVMLRRGIERTLQMAIECLLDIGNILIAANGWRAPENNREIFQVLVENGVIPGASLTKYTKMAGFRNILVHEYTRVDPATVYGVLKNGLPDFSAFIAAVGDFLRRNDEESSSAMSSNP